MVPQDFADPEFSHGSRFFDEEHHEKSHPDPSSFGVRFETTTVQSMRIDLDPIDGLVRSYHLFGHSFWEYSPYIGLKHRPNISGRYLHFSWVPESRPLGQDELQEIILYLRDPDRFTRLGAKLPKGGELGKQRWGTW